VAQFLLKCIFGRLEGGGLSSSLYGYIRLRIMGQLYDGHESEIVIRCHLCLADVLTTDDGVVMCVLERRFL